MFEVRNYPTPTRAIAVGKREAQKLITKLQERIAAIPDDGSWGEAGDIRTIVDRLGEVLEEVC